MNVPVASDNTIFLWLFSIAESFFEVINNLANDSFLLWEWDFNFVLSPILPSIPIGKLSVFELIMGTGLATFLIIRLVKFLGDALPG